MQRNLRRRRMSKRAHRREWMLRPRVPRHLGSTWHIPPCTHRCADSNTCHFRAYSEFPFDFSASWPSAAGPHLAHLHRFQRRLPPARALAPSLLQASTSRGVVTRVHRDLLIHAPAPSSTRLTHPRTPSSALRLHLPRAHALAFLCIFIDYAYSVLCIRSMHPVSLIFSHSPFQFRNPSTSSIILSKLPRILNSAA
ncbi:hypothetical protein B0H11DRAFT_667824 [Mycena galericulata]|nr:hypothetical protein B0H11DRAFT_667824 [Mycena galericulata]